MKPMPTLTASYKLWADQMAHSTPGSPPQPDSVFGQGTEAASKRSGLSIRKRRDNRSSVSSITSTGSSKSSRSLSLRRITSASSRRVSSSTQNGLVQGDKLYPAHTKLVNSELDLHLSGHTASGNSQTDPVLEPLPQSPQLHTRAHSDTSASHSNSSFSFLPMSSDTTAATAHHQKMSSVSSPDVDALEQPVQPDLTMPEKATASLDQLYSLLAERTVQLSHSSYQNTQLWNMVNRQRQMILDLQRDLDSSLELNAKYKRRLLRAVGDTASTVQSPSGSTDTTPNGSATNINGKVQPKQQSQPQQQVVASPSQMPASPSQLAYPLSASAAREFSFENQKENKTHRKTKSDTLYDDLPVPEKSSSRDHLPRVSASAGAPTLKAKKSIASVLSSEGTPILTATSMSKSASLGGGSTVGTPSIPPPPCLAPEPITLYVKPAELSTICVDVASSLGVVRKKDSPMVVLSVSDRASGKELWRCSKEYSSFVTLDQTIAPQIASFKTKIPDRSLFTSHAPARVDIRKEQLNSWFSSLFAVPRLPPSAAQTVCEFLSTNTVDPLDVPDIEGRKEGFLTKRGKSFGGWKLRYFVLDGPTLNYYESPNGPHLGSIRLYSARIGRQTQEEDSNSEDAYRHAFLIMEPRKKDYLRHVLCAENDRERDEWISALLDYVSYPEPESPSKSIHSPAVSANNSSVVYQDSIYDDYSDHHPTPDSATDSSHKGTGLGIDVADNSITSTVSASRISAPIGSELIQDLQKWGYKYSPSSLSLNAQLNEDDHQPQHPPEFKEKKKFFLFRKSNSDRQQQQQLQQQQQQQQQQQHLQHQQQSQQSQQQQSQQSQQQPEYSQTVLDGDGKQRDERLGTPSLAMSTPLQFENGEFHHPGVFGVPLLQAIEQSSKKVQDGRFIPSVVWRCINYLDHHNAHLEEGIFRLSGSASAIRTLKARFNESYDIDLVTDSTVTSDVHAVAGLLKLFLREMPDLILTQQLSPSFRRAMEIQDIVARIYELKQLVTQLPPESQDLLFVLTKYLCKIIDHQEYNKMNLRNVGIVFSPTVNVPAGIFVLFLTDFDCIFGDAQPRTDINRKLQDFPQALLG